MSRIEQYLREKYSCFVGVPIERIEDELLQECKFFETIQKNFIDFTLFAAVLECIDG